MHTSRSPGKEPLTGALGALAKGSNLAPGWVCGDIHFCHFAGSKVLHALGATHCQIHCTHFEHTLLTPVAPVGCGDLAVWATGRSIFVWGNGASGVFFYRGRKWRLNHFDRIKHRPQYPAKEGA